MEVPMRNIPLFEVENLLDVEFEEEDADTLSGFLVDYLGKVPDMSDKGKEVTFDNVTYKILEVENKHISKIKAVKHKELIEEK